MRGARIGRGSTISILALFIVDEVEIGEESRIGPATLVRCRSLKLGNRVQIKSLVAIDTVTVEVGHDSVIMEQVVIGGMKTPRSSLSIGSRVKVFPYCFINPTEPIIIEDEVGVGGANYLFTHGSWQSALDGYPIAFGPIVIRKGVWLPWRVFILPNVEIGENCTIGAGSVINKSIPANSLAAGSPAKIIASDGAHLRKKSDEGKLSYVDQILKEMLEFMEFEGATVEQHATSNGLSIRLRGGGSDARILYVQDEPGDIQDVDVLVSYTKIEGAVKEALVRRNVGWLDIESRECSFGSNKRTHEVRAFFGRFGIRFAVWGE